jgi:catechol 2,3-dioxygenase-like lactoylglutathione lyase family enzyme
MKQKIFKTCDHIGIFTNDYKRLVDFYIKKLGFEKEKEEILSKTIMKSIFGIFSDCKFVRMASGDIKIEIFSPINKTSRRKFDHTDGYNHWALCVGKREKFLQILKRKKVKILEVKRNNHLVYFIHDPDGNKIEIKECS